jgi:hypothetical protein
MLTFFQHKNIRYYIEDLNQYLQPYDYQGFTPGSTVAIMPTSFTTSSTMIGPAKVALLSHCCYITPYTRCRDSYTHAWVNSYRRNVEVRSVFPYVPMYTSVLTRDVAPSVTLGVTLCSQRRYNKDLLARVVICAHITGQLTVHHTLHSQQES